MKLKNTCKRLLLPLLTLLPLPLLLFSCSSGNEVSIAYQDRIGDVPFILMAEGEVAKKAPYTWKRFSSGPETAEALVTGSVNLATMGDTTALQLLSRYPGRFVLIGSHSSGPGRHRIVVSAEDRSILRLADLAGRKLAVKKGTSTHGGLLLVDRQKGVGLTGNILDLKPGLQLNALAAGEVDAIVASEPTPSIAEAKGYGRVLAPLRVDGMRFPIVILAEKTWANGHKKEITGLLDRLSSLYGSLDTDAAVTLLESILGLKAPVLRASMALHDYSFTPAGDLTGELTLLHRALSDQGFFKSLPDWKGSLFSR